MLAAIQITEVTLVRITSDYPVLFNFVWGITKLIINCNHFFVLLESVEETLNHRKLEKLRSGNEFGLICISCVRHDFYTPPPLFQSPICGFGMSDGKSPSNFPSVIKLFLFEHFGQCVQNVFAYLPRFEEQESYFDVCCMKPSIGKICKTCYLSLTLIIIYKRVLVICKRFLKYSNIMKETDITENIMNGV